MRRIFILGNLLFILILSILPSCSNYDEKYQTGQKNTSVQSQPTDNSQVEITRGARGGRGGAGIVPRRPTGDPYRSGYRSPTTRPAPSPGIGRGFLAFGLGALFASILNPFAGAYGFGFSLIGLLFWIAVLFIIYRFFRKLL